jgi:hypothetical protein
MKIERLKSEGLIIFECISGSKAYGTATPQSDTDIRGVFILPEEDYYGMNYVEQVNNCSNDIVYYELKRFFQLLAKNNPNILELLNIPDDCVLHRDPLFAQIRPGDFLSRLCKVTFAGYAIAQVEKAYGLNKKIRNPKDQERKSILEFCYVVEGQGSAPVKEWLSARGWHQRHCGLIGLPHMREVYGLYYDPTGGSLGFHGIMQSPAASSVSLSSVPNGLQPATIMAFNKDGYQAYCKEYREYWEWVEKRNEARYEKTLEHGKNYDAKNMMHVFRLLDMAEEVAQEGKVRVRRPAPEALLRIRDGEFSYEYLLRRAQERIEKLDLLFDQSPLPEKPDEDRLNHLLVEIRKAFYHRRRGTA